MKKYYIEISENEGYILQSQWFDTEEQAIEWSKAITYLDTLYYGMWLMSSEWDEENDTYTDIDCVREIEIGANND